MNFLFKSEFSSFFVFVGRPFWNFKNISAEKVNNLKIVFQTKNKLYQENEELKRKLSFLKIENDVARKLIQENEEFKNFFLRKNYKDDFIIATILNKPNKIFYDNFFIDLGKDQLEVGKKVYGNSYILLGEIVEVFKNTSRVKLYSSPGEKQVVVFGKEKIYFEITGRGNGNFYAEIPQNLNIKVGDYVFYPSINPEILAIVGEIESDPRQPFKKVYLYNPLNFHELKYVFVEQ